VAADQRPTVPSRLTNASEQRARGGDGALCFAIVCASPSLMPTLRVHRHRAISGLLSRCAPSFVVDIRPRPPLLNLLDPSLGLDAALGASRQGLSVVLVDKPSTSPRFPPRWCSHALRRTPSCHLAANDRFPSRSVPHFHIERGRGWVPTAE
jgi:hypothetical protein